MVDPAFAFTDKLYRDVGELQAADLPIDPSVFAHFNRH
jgi:hypothetical protein